MKFDLIFLLNNTFSPNSKPRTADFLPRVLCSAVFPSWPISILFKSTLTYLTSQVTIQCSACITSLYRTSKMSFIVLSCPSTDCTARSTTPLLPFTFVGAFTLTVFAPVLAMHTSSMTYLIACSWSDLMTTSLNAYPCSFMKLVISPEAYFPVVPFCGTTTETLAPVSLSTPTRMDNLNPISSPGKQ